MVGDHLLGRDSPVPMWRPLPFLAVKKGSKTL